MSYIFPKSELLCDATDNVKVSPKRIKEIKQKILEALLTWNIQCEIVNVRIEVMSICVDLKQVEGVTLKNLQKATQDIEVRVGASVEIVEPNSRSEYITIVILPKRRHSVNLRNIIDSKEFRESKSPLTIAMGINYQGDVMVADIDELPHMLIAGTTGSGKSVFLDDIIMSILYKASPDDVRLFMIDPKRVDLSCYNGIPHLLAPVVYEEKKMFGAIGWMETEMMRRYKIFDEDGVRNIEAYNKTNPSQKMYRIVFIIDEYAQLMTDYKSEFETVIARISRMGRAAGIHLIIATQRPTADVITGEIKSNLPCRVSFAVVDSTESKLIINETGAQRLLGEGDMMISVNSATFTYHAQAPLVTEDEIHAVVDYVIRKNK